jgi:hypothetical protein
MDFKRSIWRFLTTKRSAGGLAIIALLGIAAALYAHKLSKDSYETAIANYRNLSRNEAGSTGKKVEAAFRQVYQGIRTISQLPSVRNIASTRMPMPQSSIFIRTW